MWYINGRVESLPLTNMRYIKWLGRKYSPSPQGEGLFRNKDRQMKKTGLSRINFLKICQIRISKEIRQETDRIITALKVQVPGYIG